MTSADETVEDTSFHGAPTYGPPPQYPIDSVDNALRVLLLLVDNPAIRLTDVSRYLGVASSTAHRILAMLAFRGFVRRDDTTRGYLPGPALDALAVAALRRLDVRSRAHPILERLSTQLEETTHLGQLQGNEVHFLDSIESHRALRVASRLGRAMPAHCTSTGKALLATLTTDELLEIYPDEHLTQLTTHSIKTRSQLLKSLKRIRAQGYARSLEESEDGVTSLAVAVPGTHSARFAVNVSVPVSRMNKAHEQRIVPRLIACADELDRVLL